VTRRFTIAGFVVTVWVAAGDAPLAFRAAMETAYVVLARTPLRTHDVAVGDTVPHEIVTVPAVAVTR
jgi:hypothetical protein